MSLSDPLEALEPICRALPKLFPEVLEVVLHDLRSGKIAFIENSFSPRVVGDDSLVETENYESELQPGDTIGPYLKSNSDGSKIRSVSAVIRDGGTPVGLLCINMKMGALEGAYDLLGRLISAETDEEVDILRNDWRELANSIIARTLKDLKVPFSQVKRAERIAIVRQLHEADVLCARGAGEYVAEALGISRASFYGLLREVKKNSTDKVE